MLGQRLGEWCGHGPVLEVDISLANLALDLVGQATLLLSEAGDGDRLAFHRDVLDFRNCLLVEQPNGDFAQTIARHLLYTTWQHMLLQRLTQSSDQFLREFAHKAVKEVAYHRDLASEWTIRLGDGTEESARRMAEGLDWCWRFVPELFEVDETMQAADRRRHRPRSARVRGGISLRHCGGTRRSGTCSRRADQRPILGGRRGHHSEHLGHLARGDAVPAAHLPRRDLVMSVHFHSLKVAEIVPETTEANSIRFEIPAELREAFAFKAGQHLTLRATIDGEEVRRNYSLCTAPADARLDGDRQAYRRGALLQLGRRPVEARRHGRSDGRRTAASRRISMPARRRHLVGIAGGSGITPVMSLIKTLLREEPHSRFTLLYGNRDSSSVIFLEALAGLKDKHLGRLEIYHFLDQEEQDIELFNGMLNRERLEEAIAALVPDAARSTAGSFAGPAR